MVQFQSGNELIHQHPHPLFERLAEQGRQLLYRWETDGNGDWHLNVQMVDGGDCLGGATFSYSGRFPYCQNVGVQEAFRRQGIANTIYVFAEVVLGTHLSDFWGDHDGEDLDDPMQTSDGRSLWRQPNRPFGTPGFIAGRAIQ